MDIPNTMQCTYELYESSSEVWYLCIDQTRHVNQLFHDGHCGTSFDWMICIDLNWPWVGRMQVTNIPFYADPHTSPQTLYVLPGPPRRANRLTIELPISSYSSEVSCDRLQNRQNKRRLALLGMAITAEFGSLTEKTTTEPRTMPLSLVCDDLNIQSTALGSTTLGLRGLDPCINQMTNVTL